MYTQLQGSSSHGQGIIHDGQNCCDYCLLSLNQLLCLQSLDYTLHCPICQSNCAYGLYIHQFDASNDDCCYFSCVTCISKLRTRVGVPASSWERWDEADIAKHTKESWYPCSIYTRELMEQESKKRKRSQKKSAKSKSSRSPTVLTENKELIEKLYLYISSIEVQVNAIKRLLLELAWHARAIHFWYDNIINVFSFLPCTLHYISQFIYYVLTIVNSMYLVVFFASNWYIQLRTLLFVLASGTCVYSSTTYSNIEHHILLAPPQRKRKKMHFLNDKNIPLWLPSEVEQVHLQEGWQFNQ